MSMPAVGNNWVCRGKRSLAVENTWRTGTSGGSFEFDQLPRNGGSGTHLQPAKSVVKRSSDISISPPLIP
ncbi:hypothetical protein ACFX13_011565 [Malus domestica]